MKRLIAVSVVSFLLAGVAVFAAEGLYFYSGVYHPPAMLRATSDNIPIPTKSVSVFNGTTEKHTGTVLVDLSHSNNFRPWELDALLSRVAARGFNVRFLKDSKDLEPSLRSADAYILISPQTAVTRAQINLIKQMVGEGMKLLLIEEQALSRASYSGAKTTVIPVGEVSAEFGFIFERDYLYNLKENDGNYRNVFFTDFKQNELTKGLQKIALYSAGSLSGSDSGIVFADNNTYSSKLETSGKLSPIVLTPDANVLGIYNFTFLTEPYNASFDNSRLISNMSDWLATSNRTFSLADFPYFMNKTTLVTYTDETLLPQAMAVSSVLADEQGISPQVAKYEDSRQTGDMIFVGLYDGADKAKGILDKGKIQLTAKDVEVGGMGTLSQSAASIIYYYRQGDSNRMVILASTSQRLLDTVKLLRGGKFDPYLVSNSLAVYQLDEKK